MRSFDAIVQALVGPVIGIGHQSVDRVDIASQLIRNDDPRGAEPVNQAPQKPFGCLGVPVLLHENVEYVAVRIDSPPEPVFHTIYRDNDFVQVPLVGGGGSVALDAIGEMSTKSVHPFPNCFPADDHTAFG